jgi:hypothetical protein
MEYFDYKTYDLQLITGPMDRQITPEAVGTHIHIAA